MSGQSNGYNGGYAPMQQRGGMGLNQQPGGQYPMGSPYSTAQGLQPGMPQKFLGGNMGASQTPWQPDPGYGPGFTTAQGLPQFGTSNNPYQTGGKEPPPPGNGIWQGMPQHPGQQAGAYSTAQGMPQLGGNSDAYNQPPGGQRPPPMQLPPPIQADQPDYRQRPPMQMPPPIIPGDNGVPRGGFQPPMPGQAPQQGAGLLRPQQPWSQYYGGNGDTFGGR